MPMSSFYRSKALGAHGWKYPKLWDMSKRELIEIAIHLAAASTESYDTALETGEAFERILAEREALRAAGLV